MDNTYCIIMAGGPGSRFWPVTQNDAPKQFLDIMGTGKTMLQTTVERFEKICPRENIIIVTAMRFVDRVHEQIPGLQPYQVLGEPYRRNTAPCIAYAASVINYLNPDANIIVTPSDHAIFDEEAFVRDIRQALAITAKNDYIVTIGVRPTSPNTKYGYIQFESDGLGVDSQVIFQSSETALTSNLRKVVTFTEKPPIEMAQQFIATGEFFWNAGIFVWNNHTLRQAFRSYLPGLADAFSHIGQDAKVEDIHRIYSLCETISVDFGIMEKASNVYVLETSFGWSDVETWDLLHTALPHDNNGNVIVSGNVFTYDVHETVVHIPAGRNIVLQGLDGYIVAGDEKTILICRRDQEDRIVKFASDVELSEIMSKL